MTALLVLLFIRTDCPISIRYAPEIQRLYQSYHRQGIEFRLIYTESALDVAAMARHKSEYGLTLPSEIDLDHGYVRKAKVTVTPEAAVFAGSEMLYRGRIDDRYPALGQSRRQASRHDLEEVLSALAAGRKPAPRFSRATGCAIESSP
jgi:hypothetical protein